MNKEPEKAYDSADDVLPHIELVQKNMDLLINELLQRSNNHDQSKLYSPEKETFDKYIPLLKDVKFGTPEYTKLRQEMYENGLKHHFQSSRHHPEHFKNGINDMNLVDIVEMFIDWYSASMRSDTSFEKGLEYNIKKFKVSPQLAEIFKNTYETYFKK